MFTPMIHEQASEYQKGERVGVLPKGSSLNTVVKRDIGEALLVLGMAVYSLWFMAAVVELGFGYWGKNDPAYLLGGYLFVGWVYANLAASFLLVIWLVVWTVYRVILFFFTGKSIFD